MCVVQTIHQVREELFLHGSWKGKLVPKQDANKYLKVRLEPLQAGNGFLEFYNGQGYEFYKHI